MIKRIRAHVHYWNIWRKKFHNSYGKWYKFLVLIGFEKPHTLRLLIFADRCNAATVALNNLAEVFKQVGDAAKKEEGKTGDEVSEV